MAIVINPDGTVSTVDVYYDRDGSIKGIKGSFSTDSDYTARSSSSYSSSSYSSSPKKKKAKKKKAKKEPYLSTPTTNSKKENSSSVIVVPTPATKQSTLITSSKEAKKEDKPKKPVVVETAAEDPSLEPYFSSVVEIDRYITDKRNSNQTIALSEYMKIRRSLPGTLCNYFTSKCKAYFIYCKEMAQKMVKTTITKKKKKNKKKRSNDVTFSSKGIKTTRNDIDNGSFSGGFSRKPKYGYARDRYGRVQERDSFNEEKKNEFYTAQNRQRHYDYSSYDANDDNDGAYSNWE